MDRELQTEQKKEVIVVHSQEELRQVIKELSERENIGTISVEVVQNE